jgi:hypothetical protein
VVLHCRCAHGRTGAGGIEFRELGQSSLSEFSTQRYRYPLGVCFQR